MLKQGIVRGQGHILKAGLDPGPWTLDSGLWTLDSGHWTLDSGLWTLDSGLWTLDFSLLKLYHPQKTSISPKKSPSPPPNKKIQLHWISDWKRLNKHLSSQGSCTNRHWNHERHRTTRPQSLKKKVSGVRTWLHYTISKDQIKLSIHRCDVCKLLSAASDNVVYLRRFIYHCF